MLVGVQALFFSPDRIASLCAMKVAPTPGQQAEGRPRTRQRTRGIGSAAYASASKKASKKYAESDERRAWDAFYAALLTICRDKGSTSYVSEDQARSLFEAMAATKSRKQRRLGLTRDDLKAGLKQLKIKARDLDSLFNHIDAKEQGALSEAQWVAAFRDEEMKRSEGVWGEETVLDRAWEAYCVPPVAALARVIFAIPYAIIYGFTVGAKAGADAYEESSRSMREERYRLARDGHPKITQKRGTWNGMAPGCGGKAAGEGVQRVAFSGDAFSGV